MGVVPIRAELAPGISRVVVMVGDLGSYARSAWRSDRGVLVLSDSLTPEQMGEALAGWVRAVRSEAPAGHGSVTEGAEWRRSGSETDVGLTAVRPA